MCPNPSTPRLPLIATALLLAALATSACQPSEPWTSDNPSFALNAFLGALRMGDYDTVEQFLSDETLELLQANLDARQELLGPEANARIERPLDLLYRAWTPSAFEIDHLETIERNEHSAMVAIHNIYGQTLHVSMRRAEGRWVIDLTPGQLSADEPGSQPDTQPESP